MELVTIIIINIITFCNLLINVNHYADEVLFIEIILLCILVLFLLFRYRHKYIPLRVFITHLLTVAVQILALYILFKLNIWRAHSGFMGLGGGEIGTFFYFGISCIFLILILVINFIKYMSKQFKNLIK